MGDSERILGPDHPDTLSARDHLASSYWFAGRHTEAITIENPGTQLPEAVARQQNTRLVDGW
jgi:hypothetical protein